MRDGIFVGFTTRKHKKISVEKICEKMNNLPFMAFATLICLTLKAKAKVDSFPSTNNSSDTNKLKKHFCFDTTRE